MPAAARRAIIITLVGVTVWFVAVAVWAVRPQSDAVPVGFDTTLLPAPGRLSSIDVECNSLFSRQARSDGPLPTLNVQPNGVQPLAFQREPCALVHQNARIVLGIDVLFFVGVVGGIAVITRRRRGVADDAPPVLATAPA